MALEGRDPARPVASRRTAGATALNDVVVARGALARVCPARRRDRRAVAPRDVHRRRARRLQPDRLDRLLVQRRRPDPRPAQPQPLVTPIAGYLSAIRSVVVEPEPGRALPGRRRARGARLASMAARTSRRGRRRRRGARRGAADPPRRARGRAALLGPAPPQGGAAAVVSSRRPGAGRLELDASPTCADRAAAARARAGAQRHHRRDRGRQEPAHRCAGAGHRGAGRHERSSGTAPTPRASRRSSTALPGAADRRPRGRARAAARPPASTTRPSPPPGSPTIAGPLVEIHGQHDQQRLLDERWQRDLLDAFGGHGELRAADGRRRCARWRANRRRWRELAIDPRELDPPAGARTSTRPPRSRRRSLRPGEAEEIRAPPRRRPSTARRSPAAGADAARGARRRRRRCPRRGWRSPLREARAGAARSAVRAPRRAARRARGGARRRRLGGARLAEAVDHDPASWRRLEERLSDDLRASSAATATTRRPSSRTASGPPPRPSACAASTRSGPRARPRMPGCSRRRVRRGGAVRAPGGGGARWRADVGRSSRSWASAAASSRSRSAGARPRATSRPSRSTVTRWRSTQPGVDQVVFRLAPNPGEPARPLARIASGGELSPGRAGDQAGPRRRRRRRRRWSSTRSTRASAAGAPTRSGAACGRLARATRSCASPTCRRSRPTPTPTSRSRSASATAGPSPRSRALDREGRIVELAQMLGGAGGRRDGAAALASARRAARSGGGWRRGRVR